MRRHELLLHALFSLNLLHFDPFEVLFVVLGPNDLLDVNIALSARHLDDALVVGEMLLDLADGDVDLSELLLAKLFVTDVLTRRVFLARD